MIGRILRALAVRRASRRNARLEAMRSEMLARLAERAAERRGRAGRGRKGAATKVHMAHQRDPLIKAKAAPTA